MPLNFSRSLTGMDRTPEGNARLGYGLAFVAGATNAGAYLAVRQYTSHMTGVLSSLADALALHQWIAAGAAFGALAAFLIGAACSAVLVVFARRHRMHSAFALPLLLEALLLLTFGLLGARLATFRGVFLPVTVMLLCFTMGLQNALISKISHSVIRTTHVTGMLTDLGVECGRAVYWNRQNDALDGPVRANHERMRILSLLISSFFCGGVLGAIGFQHVGYITTVPLAALLLFFAFAPLFDDLAHARHRLTLSVNRWRWLRRG
ncbi:MAG: YoaK family protein [Gemmatimonadaceae bacterium]